MPKILRVVAVVHKRLLRDCPQRPQAVRLPRLLFRGLLRVLYQGGLHGGAQGSPGRRRILPWEEKPLLSVPRAEESEAEKDRYRTGGTQKGNRQTIEPRAGKRTADRVPLSFPEGLGWGISARVDWSAMAPTDAEKWSMLPHIQQTNRGHQ